MDHPEKNVRKILKIADIDQIHGRFRDGWKTWLPKDPNAAFLACVGAGPWKAKRRKAVQDKAIEWFRDRWNDLCAVTPNYLMKDQPYPLVWQNRMLYDLVVNLRKSPRTFFGWCNVWKDSKQPERCIREFFEMCEHPNKGTKVLWLFTRDYLNLPGFPIDRHVEDFLKKLDLPTDPWYIMDLCNSVGIDPSALNRSIFSEKSTNFSWSEEDEQSGKSGRDIGAA